MARPPRKKGASRKRSGAKAPARKQTRGAAPKRKQVNQAVNRPPEVSAEKWAKWSPAYRKRAAGFYAKHPGAPSYQMRGKGKGEHLTLAQRREERLAALAERQSYRGGKQGARDAAEIVESYRALIREHGWQAFNQMERLILSRQKGQGRITAEELGYDWSDYDGEDAELFYN